MMGLGRENVVTKWKNGRIFSRNGWRFCKKYDAVFFWFLVALPGYRSCHGLPTVMMLRCVPPSL